VLIGRGQRLIGRTIIWAMQMRAPGQHRSTSIVHTYDLDTGRWVFAKDRVGHARAHHVAFGAAALALKGRWLCNRVRLAIGEVLRGRIEVVERVRQQRGERRLSPRPRKRG